MAVRAVRRASALQRSARFVTHQPGTVAITILSIAALVDVVDLLFAIGGVAARGITSWKHWRLEKKLAKEKKKQRRHAQLRYESGAYQDSGRKSTGLEGTTEQCTPIRRGISPQDSQQGVSSYRRGAYIAKVKIIPHTSTETTTTHQLPVVREDSNTPDKPDSAVPELCDKCVQANDGS